jgi:hypothetical protein
MVVRLKVKRNQARYTLHQVQLHSHKVLPVNRLNMACPARSPQWGNIPAVLTPSIKDQLQNRLWRKRSRRPCPVHKLSDKARRWLHITPAHLHIKVLHPDQPRTRSSKVRSSKGCNHRQDSNRHHTPVPILLLRLLRRKSKHRDRRSLRRRNLHLLHQCQQFRVRPRPLSLQDPLLLSRTIRHNHLRHRPQVRRFNKLLRLLNKPLRRLQWLTLRLPLNIHLRFRQSRSLYRHSHQRLLLRHSSKRPQLYLQPLHPLQWLLRHLLHQRSHHRSRQLLHRRQHQWHRRLQQIRTHMVV